MVQVRDCIEYLTIHIKESRFRDGLNEGLYKVSDRSYQVE